MSVRTRAAGAAAVAATASALLAAPAPALAASASGDAAAPGSYAIVSREAPFLQANNNILPQGGDDVSVVLSTTAGGNLRMPFPVKVYNQNRTRMVVNSNGYISFPASGTGANDFSNTCLPTSDLGPDPVLAPHWDDLVIAASNTTVPGSGIFTRVFGTAPNRKFVVNWRGRLFSNSGAFVRFGVIFTERSGIIRYQYLDNQGASATVGVQRTGASTQYSCDGTQPLFAGLQLELRPSLNR